MQLRVRLRDRHPTCLTDCVGLMAAQGPLVVHTCLIPCWRQFSTCCWLLCPAGLLEPCPLHCRQLLFCPLLALLMLAPLLVPLSPLLHLCHPAQQGQQYGSGLRRALAAPGLGGASVPQRWAKLSLATDEEAAGVNSKWMPLAAQAMSRNQVQFSAGWRGGECPLTSAGSSKPVVAHLCCDLLRHRGILRVCWLLHCRRRQRWRCCELSGIQRLCGHFRQRH